MKKLKPFDLKTALNGEPVMLRNGSEAYIRHHETELSITTYEALIGYHEDLGLWSWCTDGSSSFQDCESGYDIVGMYPRDRIINGFKVPAPETVKLESGCKYFTPHICRSGYFEALCWYEDNYDYCALDRGLVFLHKEDAIANAKAMLGIDPGSPSMD